MKIREVMRPLDSLITVNPHLTLGYLINYYQTPGLESRLFHVVDEQFHLLGVITLFDILNLLLPQPLIRKYVDSKDPNAESDLLDADIRLVLESLQDRSAQSIMTPEYPSVGPDELLVAAHKVILEKKTSAIPVLNADGQLVGEITRRIILKFLSKSLYTLT